MKFIGEENSVFIPIIRHYLSGKNQLIKHDDDVLVVKEEAVTGLVDFIFDHMNYTEVYFTVDDDLWLPNRRDYIHRSFSMGRSNHF